MPSISQVAPYGVIYTITNLMNGKQYIGQTIQPVRRRWVKHISDARIGGKNKCSTLWNAIRKYGPDAFDIEAIIACDNKEELDHVEIMAIELGGTLAPDGYNLMTGGANGNPSAETRAKLSAAWKGRTPSENTLAILSEARRGKPRPDLSERNRSEEERAKHRGINNHNARPVMRGDGMRFDTLTEAARSVGGDTSNVHKCCRGRLKIHKGFTWRYIEG